MTAEKKKANFGWKKEQQWATPPESEIQTEKLKPTNDNQTVLSEPIEFFRQFFNIDFIERTTFQTNLYNTQRSVQGYKVAVKRRRTSDTSFKKVKPVTQIEIQRLFGIVLYMGIHKLPSRRMYWATKTCVPIIADSLTRNRYEEILSILHFSNNQEAATDPADPEFNKMYKLQPVIEHFSNVFKASVVPETMQAIDEMMIPFKGRHSAKIYMPKKPTKWGYKLWCRADISGYVYDFEVLGSPYAKGPPADLEETHRFGESEYVIMRCQKI